MSDVQGRAATADGERTCLCGCGAIPGASANYRPGHDSRHVAAIGRRLRELGVSDPALLGELPSAALRAKAVAMLDGGRSVAASVTSEPAPIDPRSTADLLAGYASILAELRRRHVVRSNNAPAGDYGEWLVARAVNGQLVDNSSMKSYDLVIAEGKRVQVKARVVSTPVGRAQLQTSPFRSFDFEIAALVLLRDVDYAVHRAVLVPVQLVRAFAKRTEHVNGWRLSMTPEVLDHQDAEDITAAMRRAAQDA